MNMVVKLNSDNIDDLAAIDCELEHQGDTANNISLVEQKQYLLSRFKDGFEVFFGYKLGNELVGYVTLKPFFPGYKHCEVYWLAVKKKNQGSGIGTELMIFIENYALSLGFRKVCLYTGKDMFRTREFYEKLGYTLINEFPDYYGFETGNTTAVLYGKSISK